MYIAQNSKEGKRVGLNEISKQLDLPHHFLSKILQSLVRSKLLSSSKGVKGGFTLNKNASEVSLIHIVSAIDGMEMFDDCVLGLKECSDLRPCPVHAEYKPVKEKFLKVLSAKSLEDLSKDLSTGKVFLVLKKP